ncbi:hypothetical protein ACI7RC_27210 [Brevibacillus sp. B_LB10_24]|uniref:hypothetical protein n=1 Tax=Brevibacillus sp. B_LB10_24 TaxID=3380645 RepID=UPI0038BB5C76
MARNNTGLEHENERRNGLKRDLKTSQLTMIAMGCAIGTGLFLGSGFTLRRG